ncbi:MAG: NAD-dependent epimerase/dehydratase family protein [Pseudomonadota bacterium]
MAEWQAAGAVDRVLVVTGSSGRLGRLLRAAWARTPPAGLRLIWSGRGPEAALPWDIAAGPVDLPRGCVVLHLAAVLRGTAAEMAQNAVMATHVAQAALDCGAARILMASTIAVYGARATPCDEDDTPRPFSPYGRAKLAAELALMQAAAPIAATALRIGNVVGADALLGAAGQGQGAIVLDPVPGQAGGPVRSWIGPQRLAQVIVGLIALPDLPQVLNIAADPPAAMGDLLEAAGKPWQSGPENPAVLPRAVLNIRRLCSLIDMPPTLPRDLVADWHGLLHSRP